MAISAGFISAEALIQSISGSTRAEAAKLVQVGTMLAETDAAEALAAAAAAFAEAHPDWDASGDDADGHGADGAGHVDSGGPYGTGFDPDDPAGLDHGAGPDGRDGRDFAGADPATPGTPGTLGGAGSSSHLFPGMPVWQAPIARAVAAGLLSVDGAEAIRRGLGGIDDAVTAEQLTTAAEQLITAVNPGNAGAGRVLGADEVQRLARHLRDELDTEGIRRREKEQYDLRAVRRWRTADGMHHGIWHLHPEDGALLDSAFSTILSPRRGGPRFVDEAEQAKAQKLVNDPRTDEQILADALVAMIRLATDADPGTMFGSRRPAVRVIITKKDLTTGAGAATGTGTGTGVATITGLGTTGTTPATAHISFTPGPGAPGAGVPLDDLGHHALPPLSPQPLVPLQPQLPGISADQGWIEGTLDPVSIETIQRNLCDTGHIPVLFDDDGQCLNVGHTQRHFTPPTTHRPRAPRRRLHVPLLRPTPHLVRSTPHQTLGQRPRTHRHRQRNPPLPTPPPPPPRQPLGNHQHQQQLPAPTTKKHRPHPNPHPAPQQNTHHRRHHQSHHEEGCDMSDNLSGEGALSVPRPESLSCRTRHCTKGPRHCSLRIRSPSGNCRSARPTRGQG